MCFDPFLTVLTLFCPGCPHARFHAPFPGIPFIESDSFQALCVFLSGFVYCDSLPISCNLCLRLHSAFFLAASPFSFFGSFNRFPCENVPPPFASCVFIGNRGLLFYLQFCSSPSFYLSDIESPPIGEKNYNKLAFTPKLTRLQLAFETGVLPYSPVIFQSLLNFHFLSTSYFFSFSKSCQTAL